jgi:hypothetical protein
MSAPVTLDSSSKRTVEEIDEQLRKGEEFVKKVSDVIKCYPGIVEEQDPVGLRVLNW